MVIGIETKGFHAYVEDNTGTEIVYYWIMI